MALVAAYMTAAAGASIGYAKTIAPLMARTDFATMLKLTPECEFLSINSELLRAIVISTTDLQMNEPLFPNGIYRDSRSRGSGNPDALAGLTRRRWLQGIAVDEVDYLTAAEFNSNPDLNVTDPDAPKSDLESMGARGTTTEAVGPNAKQAPIFEIRSLGQVANPKAFSERALWIFDYLAQINQ